MVCPHKTISLNIYDYIRQLHNYSYMRFIIHPANFVCGGYTVFMLSVRVSVRNVLFP